MDASTKTYQVDKHKQLIPLNGSMVNFSCFFEVANKDKKPFQITVVEQGEIKPKEYKLVDNGYINGKIESDGQLKAYFLVLKAQQPCECDVTIKLQPKEEHNPLPPSQPQPPNQPQPNPSNQSSLVDSVVIQKPESYFQVKYILGLSAVIVLAYLIYKYRKEIFGASKKLMPSTSSIGF